MSIKAMKLALEALEAIHPGNMTPMAEEAWNKAITALRQAIEQAAKEKAPQSANCEASGWINSDHARGNDYTIEQAEQAQPVEFNGWYCAHCQRGVDSSEVTYHEQHTVCGRVITDDLPPAPPPRQPWVGLTPEERAYLRYEADIGPDAIIKATEAKLKEKNA